MKKTFPSLPDWVFDIEEVSAGVYEVVGRDRAGHIVSAKGSDPYQLIDECQDRAKKIKNVQ
jgi:hypothetical protein